MSYKLVIKSGGGGGGNRVDIAERENSEKYSGVFYVPGNLSPEGDRVC